MTDNERCAALALERCTYLPGTFEKRFARSVAAIAQSEPKKELTEKQRAWLWKQVWRYRRQLGAGALDLIPAGALAGVVSVDDMLKARRKLTRTAVARR